MLHLAMIIFISSSACSHIRHLVRVPRALLDVLHFLPQRSQRYRLDGLVGVSCSVVMSLGFQIVTHPTPSGSHSSPSFGSRQTPRRSCDATNPLTPPEASRDRARPRRHETGTCRAPQRAEPASVRILPRRSALGQGAEPSASPDAPGAHGRGAETVPCARPVCPQRCEEEEEG